VGWGRKEGGPGMGGGRCVEFFGTGEDAVCCFGFGDVRLVVEEGGVLAVVDLISYRVSKAFIVS
jgi:hypothetical protein